MKLQNLILSDHGKNPIIKAPFPEWIVADPFVLTPSQTPDHLWYLFAHTIIGLRYYTSKNGLDWSRPSSPLVFFGYRPFVYQERKHYYLLYEKIKNPLRFPYYDSHIEIRHSTDLIHWSSPQTLFSPTLSWHKTKNHLGNVGNPCLLKIKNRYHLYYSSGLSYFKDTMFCEPQSVGLAVSSSLLGPYIPRSRPLNLRPSLTPGHVSSHRPFRLKSILASLQTHLHLPSSGKSKGFIHLATSSNHGFSWKTHPIPLISPSAPWKKSHVYVGDLKHFKDRLFLYYNGRSGWLFGSESIGLALA